jgi:hypothetical protein
MEAVRKEQFLGHLSVTIKIKSLLIRRRMVCNRSGDDQVPLEFGTLKRDVKLGTILTIYDTKTEQLVYASYLHDGDVICNRSVIACCHQYLLAGREEGP